MKTVNIQAAKTHLSRLVEEVVAGEEIILAKAGKPLVRLIPFQEPVQARKLGILRGKVIEHAECWNVDPALEKDFANDIFPLNPGPESSPRQS